MFCCQLEELIRWLYRVADITDGWVPPSPDAESLKVSLHRCLVGYCRWHFFPFFGAAGSKQCKATPARGKQLPGQPAAGFFQKKTFLNIAPLLLPFPGVQERCGRPPEPDRERAGEGRGSP